MKLFKNDKLSDLIIVLFTVLLIGYLILFNVNESNIIDLIVIITVVLVSIYLTTLYLKKSNEERIRTEISEAAFNNADEGIFVVDSNINIIQVNASFSRITGYSEIDVFMKNPRILRGRLDSNENDYDSMWEELNNNGHWSGIFINQRKDGREFYAKNSISTIKRDGKILYYISIFSDVTKEKEQNDKLEKMAKDLETSFNELKNAQEKIVKTEKLSALGQLIAGISHEINSPLGAIKTSSSNALNNMYTVINNISNIEKILDNQQKEEFDCLKSNFKFEQSFLSIKEQRTLKKELKKQLDEFNIDDSRDIADKLSNFNIENIDKYINLLRHENIKYIIDILYKEYITISNLYTISRSVDRASKTIFALKKFVHFDHENNIKLEKIEDSLNSILVLFSHNLRQGITVIKDFKKLDAIYCYPDELAQVWMNLISNSLHAMNNQGTLTILIDEDEDYQIVCIKDTGYGIPKEIEEKIFEPFFTTKPAGEGSGLGLDIVKKIVEGHNGKIELENYENDTTFKIYLSKKINKF